MASFLEVSKQWKEETQEPMWCKDKSCKGSVALAKRLHNEQRTETSN